MQKLETIRKYFDIKLISIFNIVLIMWTWTHEQVGVHIYRLLMTWVTCSMTREPFSIIPCRKHFTHDGSSSHIAFTELPTPPGQPVWQDVYSAQLQGTLTSRISALTFKSRPEKVAKLRRVSPLINTSLSRAGMGRFTNLTTRVSFDI